MVTKANTKRRRSHRYLSVSKPSRTLHPRVQKIGREHFGVIAVDCAKGRFSGLIDCVGGSRLGSGCGSGGSRGEARDVCRQSIHSVCRRPTARVGHL